MEFKSEFERDVFKGLTDKEKHLSSKYFYDKKGDALFQNIMNLPEYYLTRKEYWILQNRDIAKDIWRDADNGIDIIELGAGDGYKTKVLLQKLLDLNADINYVPIDISKNVLNLLCEDLKQSMPQLDVKPQVGEYFKVINRLSSFNKRKKVILFLGSNIGNLLHPIAIDFLKKLRSSLNVNDIILMGFDLVKDPEIILAAYNDSQGVTASFNKNLLERINRELRADFDLDQFTHLPSYDPVTGTCRSDLVSDVNQTVTIEALNLVVHFEEGEKIHTEISQKYTREVIEWLCEESGLKIDHYYTDEENWFSDYLLKI